MGLCTLVFDLVGWVPVAVVWRMLLLPLDLRRVVVFFSSLRDRCLEWILQNWIVATVFGTAVFRQQLEPGAFPGSKGIVVVAVVFG